MSAQPYTHKIGASLHLLGQLTLSGQAQDMTGWTVAAHMRGPGGTYALTAVWTDAAVGALALSASPAEQQSAGWQPGRYAVDVRLESPSGQVLISSTAQIVLTEAVTQPVPVTPGGTP